MQSAQRCGALSGLPLPLPIPRAALRGSRRVACPGLICGGPFGATEVSRTEAAVKIDFSSTPPAVVPVYRILGRLRQSQDMPPRPFAALSRLAVQDSPRLAQETVRKPPASRVTE